MNDFAAGMLVGLAGLTLVGGILALVWYFRQQGQGSSRERMLARQYRAMTDSAGGELPLNLLKRPELIASRMEFRKIEAIQAELANDADRALAEKLLRSFFGVEDPWVRACAAKALYPLDHKGALAEIQELLKSSTPYNQIPGIWALSEIPVPYTVELLKSLVWSKNAEVQQAVIHSLVQLELKARLPADSLKQVQQLLKEVRFKTDWIL